MFYVFDAFSCLKNIDKSLIFPDQLLVTVTKLLAMHYLYSRYILWSNLYCKKNKEGNFPLKIIFLMSIIGNMFSLKILNIFKVYNDVCYKFSRKEIWESIKMYWINIHLTIGPFNDYSICTWLLHTFRIKCCTTNYFSVQVLWFFVCFRAYTKPIQILIMQIL